MREQGKFDKTNLVLDIKVSLCQTQNGIEYVTLNIITAYRGK